MAELKSSHIGSLETAEIGHYRTWGVRADGLELCYSVPQDIAKRLLARIRELREARGLSQEAFAERAGLKYKHYQAVEAGRKPNIQLPTLLKISRALDLEPWQLLHFEFLPDALSEPAGNDFQTKAGTGRGKPAKGRSSH